MNLGGLGNLGTIDLNALGMGGLDPNLMNMSSVGDLSKMPMPTADLGALGNPAGGVDLSNLGGLFGG
jgi:hypothetical protein